MADYYTNFSFILPLKDAAQKEYALQIYHLASQSRNEDQPLPADFPEFLKDQVEDWCFELEDCEEGIWLHSESGGIDPVCNFVQHLLKLYNPSGRITFEWSHDCNHPRIDAYGGGAAIVTAKQIKSMNTSDWLRKNTHSKPKSKTGRHVFSPHTHLCIKCGVHANDDLLENQPCTH